MDIYISLASSLGRDMEQMTAVASNISNSATPGFKRWIQPQTDTTGINPKNMVEGRDLSAGKPVVTDAPLDVYLPEGVYLATSDANQDLYVRGGQLRVDHDGQLVNEENIPIRIDGVSAPLQNGIHLSPDGRVFTLNGEEIGRLSLVKSSQANLIRPSLYALEQAQAIPSGMAVIQTGAYEGSNVQITDEMVTIMKTMRHLESAQHILKHEDALNERLFSALAKF